MSKPGTLFLLVLLLVPSLTFAQRSRSHWAAANAWQSFHTAFRVAVNKRDRAAMLRMMPDDFFDAAAAKQLASGYDS